MILASNLLECVGIMNQIKSYSCMIDFVCCQDLRTVKLNSCIPCVVISDLQVRSVYEDDC
jgi:hypothetical protein